MNKPGPVCACFHLDSHPNSSRRLLLLLRDYIDINIATPRFMVEPDMVDRAYQPLAKAWKRAKLINVKAIRGVTSGRVDIIDSEGNEQVLEADGIIVATGAVQSSPLIKDVQGKSKDARKAEFIAFRDAVKNSKAGVLVIGGGTTGVELIAEIATDFTNVNCTLVNKPQLLLSESKQNDGTIAYSSSYRSYLKFSSSPLHFQMDRPRDPPCTTL